MPICCELDPQPMTRDEYHALDYAVMGLVFDLHKKLGRLHHEKIYQRKVAHVCEKNGYDVRLEVPIRVTFESFSKTYFMDLVINQSVDYELKAVEALNENHHNQALNYVLLADIKFGKLVNMRPSSVDSEYVTTTLTPEGRRDVRYDMSGWVAPDEQSERVASIITDLVSDWGAFLDCGLYREAVYHFFGGIEKVLRPVEIVHEGLSLGQEKMPLLNASTGLEISAVKKAIGSYETHLRKRLACTSLEALQWVNFNGREIRFTTLRPDLV